MNTLHVICHCEYTYMSVLIHFSQSNHMLHCTHFIFLHLTKHLFSICEFCPRKYQASKKWSRTKTNCDLVGHTTGYPMHPYILRKPSGQRSWKFAAALTVSWLRLPFFVNAFPISPISETFYKDYGSVNVLTRSSDAWCQLWRGIQGLKWPWNQRSFGTTVEYTWIYQAEWWRRTLEIFLLALHTSSHFMNFKIYVTYVLYNCITFMFVLLACFVNSVVRRFDWKLSYIWRPIGSSLELRDASQRSFTLIHCDGKRFGPLWNCMALQLPTYSHQQIRGWGAADLDMGEIRGYKFQWDWLLVTIHWPYQGWTDFLSLETLCRR